MPPAPQQPDPGLPASKTLFTVSAVTAMVKDAIAEHLPPTLHVVGQISNYKLHTSGHVYLTLKDDESELSAVMWKSAAGKLAFKPEDGMEVIATGYVDVFDRAGRYQLYCRKLEPRGVGALELAFRQMREKLHKEGLFDPRHKKPLPRYPQRIAVITSPTGAAVRDIVQTLARRFPAADVLIVPVLVQGPGAAAQIADAIAQVNRLCETIGGVDTIIAGRGGGSLEDLWAFNEEIVARAIFTSHIPVISAVGHETDVTIADLVADVRAATPTAAAELAVPDRNELLQLLRQREASLLRQASHAMELAESRFGAVAQRRAWTEPLVIVERRGQLIDEWATRVHRTCWERVHGLHGRVRQCEQALLRIAPQRYIVNQERILAARRERLRLAIEKCIARETMRLGEMSTALRGAHPKRRLPAERERVDRLVARIVRAVQSRQARAGDRVAAQADRLSALGHRSTLRRGFSITRTKRGRHIVRDPSDVREGARIVTETAAGEFESRVIDREQMDLFDT